MKISASDLFPKEIFISQGKTGDCYLLAAFRALISLEKTKAYLNKIFQLSNDGRLVVALTHNIYSVNLNKSHLQEKGYEYSYNQSLGLDIFVISEEKLKKIAKESAVTTNSLALKVLEHLIPYYFYADWKQVEDDSVASHSIKGRMNLVHRESGSQPFVAKLLGLSVRQGFDLEELKKFDSIVDQAITLSINYGKRDADGNIHGRHVFSVKKVEAKSNMFTLINPWYDSVDTKGEEISLEKLSKLNPRYTIFSLRKDPLLFLEEKFKFLIQENIGQNNSQHLNMTNILDRSDFLSQSSMLNQTPTFTQSFISQQNNNKLFESFSTFLKAFFPTQDKKIEDTDSLDNLDIIYDQIFDELNELVQFESIYLSRTIYENELEETRLEILIGKQKEKTRRLFEKKEKEFLLNKIKKSVHTYNTNTVIEAIRNHRTVLLDLLLQSGLNPNGGEDKKDKNYGFPLILAFQLNFLESVHILLEYGADPEPLLKLETGPYCLLQDAVKNNNATQLNNFLTNYKINLNKEDTQNNLLSYAMDKGYKLIVNLLLTHGADGKKFITKSTRSPILYEMPLSIIKQLFAANNQKVLFGDIYEKKDSQDAAFQIASKHIALKLLNLADPKFVQVLGRFGNTYSRQSGLISNTKYVDPRDIDCLFSRYHCVVGRFNGKVFIFDLKTPTGTKVYFIQNDNRELNFADESNVEIPTSYPTEMQKNGIHLLNEISNPGTHIVVQVNEKSKNIPHRQFVNPTLRKERYFTEKDVQIFKKACLEELHDTQFIKDYLYKRDEQEKEAILASYKEQVASIVDALNVYEKTFQIPTSVNELKSSLKSLFPHERIALFEKMIHENLLIELIKSIVEFNSIFNQLEEKERNILFNLMYEKNLLVGLIKNSTDFNDIFKFLSITQRDLLWSIIKEKDLFLPWISNPSSLNKVLDFLSGEQRSDIFEKLMETDSLTNIVKKPYDLARVLRLLSDHHRNTLLSKLEEGETIKKSKLSKLIKNIEKFDDLKDLLNNTPSEKKIKIFDLVEEKTWENIFDDIEQAFQIVNLIEIIPTEKKDILVEKIIDHKELLLIMEENLDLFKSLLNEEQILKISPSTHNTL